MGVEGGLAGIGIGECFFNPAALPNFSAASGKCLSLMQSHLKLKEPSSASSKRYVANAFLEDVILDGTRSTARPTNFDPACDAMTNNINSPSGLDSLSFGVQPYCKK